MTSEVARRVSTSASVVQDALTDARRQPAAQDKEPTHQGGGLASPTEDEPMASGWEDSDFMAELQRYARQSRTGEDAPSAQTQVPAPTKVPTSPMSAGRMVEQRVPNEASGSMPQDAPSPRPTEPGDTSSHALSMPDEEPSADPAAEPGFVVQARRRAFWSSPAVRLALLVLVLVQGALLVAQWAIHERDQVAARWPDTRPVLLAVCEHLGCSVGPLRRIDDVVIDSSALVRKIGNFYAFDLVLKNKANVPVAVPALELSLTGLRDEVISRRVFLPNELPGLSDQVPANGSVSTSLRLSIAPEGDAAMSGYRALVFYP